MKKGVKKEMRKDSAGVAVAGGFFRIALYICVIVAIIYVGKTAYGFGYSIFNQRPMESGDGTDVTVVIKDGTSVYKIGKILESKDLIEDAKVFVIQEKLSNYKDSLKSGTYILNTSMTPEEQMAILAQENTEGQPAQQLDESEETPEQGNADAVYDKVSEDVEAGDTEEEVQEETPDKETSEEE